MLVIAGDLVSKFYRKIYNYAKSRGMPAEIDVGEFLSASEDSTTSEYKHYFIESLQYYGVDIKKFQSLKSMKQLRNSAFHCFDTPKQLINTLKSSHLEEFSEVIKIAEDYPVAFGII